MSRHRNVRNYAYEDEMSEDVYGHSVEEHDMCVSPSTAQQFMYNRGNDNEQSNLFSNYMSGRFGSVEEEEEEEQLEEEDHLSNSQDYRRPQLDPISEAKLSSCLDQLQSILGDDCHEPTAVDAILKFNFDAERALDYIFSKENKKESSQKKTPKKQDANLYKKLLKKNIATKSVNNQREAKIGGLQHSKTNSQSNENNNCISDGSSLLSMPLSSIMIEGRENSINEVKAANASKNQLPFMPLGSVMAGSHQAEEQTAKEKLFQESCFTLSSLCDKSGSGGMSSSTSLSGLAKHHDESTRPKPVGLRGISLQELANQTSSPITNKSHSSNEPVDMLTSTSLSGLAEQHDESVRPKSVGLPGISLQELANQMPLSTTKMSQSSNEPVDMLTSTSLSGLAKQHNASTRPKPVGLHGISLQQLANQMPLSTTKMSHSSNESVDMLTSTSLSGLAKLHDESTRPKPVGLPGISLQQLANQMSSPLTNMSQSSNEPKDMLALTSLSSLAKWHDESTKEKPKVQPGISLQELAKQMPPAYPNQDRQFPTTSHNTMDVDMSDLVGKEPQGNTNRALTFDQNTQGSTKDRLFATSLSGLASLSLDSNTSKKSLKTSGMNHGPSGKNISAASVSSILSDGCNSRHGIDSLEQSLLYTKQDKKQVQGSRCKEKFKKVIPKSMKKKRTRKISKSSLMLMHPSLFAQTLCYKTKRKHSILDHLKSKKLCTSGYHINSKVTAFHFSSPSPDDIIKMKQQQRFGVEQKA